MPQLHYEIPSPPSNSKLWPPATGLMLAVVFGYVMAACTILGSWLSIRSAQTLYKTYPLSILPEGSALEWKCVGLPFAVCSGVLILCALFAVGSACRQRTAHKAINALGAVALLAFAWIGLVFALAMLSFECFP